MTLPSPVNVGPNVPLRLADAVKIAFPMGGMTVSGLRKEIRRNRLTVEVMAGKQFTTLAAIEERRREAMARRRRIRPLMPILMTKNLSLTPLLPGHGGKFWA